MRRVESKIRFEVPTTEEIPSFEQWRERANICGNPRHDLDYSRIFRKFVETTKGGTRKPRGKISERSATTELRKQVGEERARIEGSIFDVNRSWRPRLGYIDSRPVFPPSGNRGLTSQTLFPFETASSSSPFTSLSRSHARATSRPSL